MKISCPGFSKLLFVKSTYSIKDYSFILCILVFPEPLYLVLQNKETFPVMIPVCVHVNWSMANLKLAANV